MGDRVLFAQVISFPTLSYSHWALLSHLEKERCSAQGTTTCRASEGFYSQWSQLKMDHEKIQKNLTTGECVALGNWSTTVTRGMLGYVWSWHMHLIRMSVKGSQRKNKSPIWNYYQFNFTENTVKIHDISMTVAGEDTWGNGTSKWCMNPFIPCHVGSVKGRLQTVPFLTTPTVSIKGTNKS